MMQKTLTILVLLLTAFRLPSCKNTQVEVVDLDPLVQKALYDTTSSYYTDFSTYPKNIADLPIGVFELGNTKTYALDCALGLDCFDNITGGESSDFIRDFAGENFIFYTALSDADSIYDANGALDIHDAAIKHTLFLVGDKCAEGEKERAKIVIAAGNITRDGGLSDIRSMLDASGSGVKVLGVVEEGVKGLLDALDRSPIINYAVGMIADSVTISSGAYQQTLKDVMAERGLKSNLPLVCQPVDMADSLSVKQLSAALATMIETHYAAGKPNPICALVADFPVSDDQKAAFQDVINNYRSKRINGDYPYRSAINDRLIYINPSECAAKECYRVLRADNNLALRIGETLVTHYTDLPM